MCPWSSIFTFIFNRFNCHSFLKFLFSGLRCSFLQFHVLFHFKIGWLFLKCVRLCAAWLFFVFAVEILCEWIILSKASNTCICAHVNCYWSGRIIAKYKCTLCKSLGSRWYIRHSTLNRWPLNMACLLH